MESVLIVITLVSLAMTIALGILLIRLMREERRRSDARIAVLREMADDVAGRQTAIDPSPRQAAVDPLPRQAMRVETVKIATPRVEPVARWEASDDAADDLDLLVRTADVPPVTDLFTQPAPRSAWPRRLAVAAGLAMVVTVALIGLRSRSTSTTTAENTNSQTASVQATGLLQLLSLKQTQETGALTITGLVQNPRDGTVLSKVRATALLFGADGTFLGSGGAPLDFTVLRPGDESGFVINVPVTSPVARYRIGFRSEDGHVIGHVDRRTAATMATGEAAAGRQRGIS